MKKNIFMVLTAVLLVFFLALSGCGGDDASEEASDVGDDIAGDVSGSEETSDGDVGTTESEGASETTPAVDDAMDELEALEEELNDAGLDELDQALDDLGNLDLE